MFTSSQTRIKLPTLAIDTDNIGKCTCISNDHMISARTSLIWFPPGQPHAISARTSLIWSPPGQPLVISARTSLIWSQSGQPNMISTRTASYDLNQDGFIWSQPWLFYYFCKWFMELINTFQSHLRWFLKIIYYFFQSDKKSERDLWRGYIVGVARVRILTTEGG
jgi:hypothetical protein